MAISNHESEVLLLIGDQSSGPGEEIAFSPSGEQEEDIESLEGAGLIRVSNIIQGFDGSIVMLKMTRAGWEEYQARKSTPN